MYGGLSEQGVGDFDDAALSNSTDHTESIFSSVVESQEVVRRSYCVTKPQRACDFEKRPICTDDDLSILAKLAVASWKRDGEIGARHFWPAFLLDLSFSAELGPAFLEEDSDSSGASVSGVTPVVPGDTTEEGHMDGPSQYHSRWRDMHGNTTNPTYHEVPLSFSVR